MCSNLLARVEKTHQILSGFLSLCCQKFHGHDDVILSRWRRRHSSQNFFCSKPKKLPRWMKLQRGWFFSPSEINCSQLSRVGVGTSCPVEMKRVCTGWNAILINELLKEKKMLLRERKRVLVPLAIFDTTTFGLMTTGPLVLWQSIETIRTLC